MQARARLHWILIAIMACGSCASRPPPAIDRLPADNPSLNRVRMDIDSFIGREVRWGGIIGQVENKADKTWIELVRFPLRDSGRPRVRSLSDGRFIASFARFVDPVVYETGRPLTIVGSIVGKVRRPIGEHLYQFPIVEVTGAHLWQPEAEVQQHYYPPPWWYYDPWYPFPPPYHYHRHR